VLTRPRLLLALLTLLGLLVSCMALASGPFAFSEETDFVSLSEGRVPVLRYVKGEILPEGLPEDRRRSTYVHPLYSIDGVPITGDGPKDHPHHRGLSWMWLTVSFGGVTKDLWTLKGIHQRYEKHETQVLADRAVLLVNSRWEEDSTKRRILDESVAFTVYGSDGVGRVIDFELRLTAIDTPVAIGVSHTGYSGLSLRFAPRQDTTITTSRGPVTKDSDRIRYAWADLSARYGKSGEFDGVAIFDNRSNPHFPTGWTLRSYGILNPAFTSTASDYTIEPGKPLVLKYRIYVHKGKADPAKLHALFAGYDRGEN